MNLYNKTKEELINVIEELEACNKTLISESEKNDAAHKKLKEVEKKLREAQQMAHLGYWNWDVKTGEVEWSEEVYRTFGLNADCFTPKIDSILALSPWPEDHHRDQELINRAIESHQTGSYEQKFLRPDNSTGYYYSTFQGVYDVDGDLISIFGTILDISERKIAEEKYFTSEEKYRQLFDNILDHVHIYDVIDNERFKVIAVNPAQEKEIGRLRVGCYMDDCLEAGLYDQIIPSFRQCTSEKKTVDFEVNIDGCDFYSQLIPLKNALNIVDRVIVIARNVTNEEKLKKQLIKQNSKLKKLNTELTFARDKAEESDRLKTAFLHNISHEIRTPMNAIVGFSTLLNDPDLDNAERQHFAKIVIESSNQLLSIISDIINIASIEAGQEISYKDIIDLNSILTILHTQFLLMAEKKNLSLNFFPSLADNEDKIITDKTKLIQILTNLLTNALKFSKHGHINFGYNVKDSVIEFFVEDTGIGVPDDMHEEIFKRFRQLETAESRNYGGSGLGLSISKAYVEFLGGNIWLVSEFGKGSTFYFTIPYKKPVIDTITEIFSSDGNNIEIYQHKTILIAEDEDSNYFLLKALLSDMNMDIIWAKNGLEAVEYCKSNNNIDLILMDIKMPVMDGLDATKRIKEIIPDVPVIAQTAYTFDKNISKALDCGCNDFISKPLKKELLILKIKEQLSAK